MARHANQNKPKQYACPRVLVRQDFEQKQMNTQVA